MPLRIGMVGALPGIYPKIPSTTNGPASHVPPFHALLRNYCALARTISGIAPASSADRCRYCVVERLRSMSRKTRATCSVVSPVAAELRHGIQMFGRIPFQGELL